ncbi:flippase [Vibrio cyclitrophicus]
MAFKQNVFYLAIVQISQYIIPLITFPYLTRTLTAEGFGELGFYTAIFAYVILITEYGFSLTATAEIAKNKTDKKELNRVFWSVINIKLLLAVTSTILAFSLAIIFLEESSKILILACFVPAAIGNVVYPVWFFLGLGEMKFITLSTLLAKTISIPITFWIVNSPEDVGLAALIQSSTILLSGLISVFLIKRNNYVGKYEFNFYFMKETFINGYHVFLGTVSVNLYTSSTVFILGLISGSYFVGLFNAANTLVKSAISMFNPIYQALFPKLTETFKRDKIEGFSIVKKTGTLALLLSLLATLPLIVFSSEIIELIVGKGYEDSVLVLKILSATIPLSVVNNILGVQTLLPLGYKKNFLNIVMFGAVLNIVIMPVLCYYLNAAGAALSVLMTEITMMILLIRTNIKIRRLVVNA